MRRIVLAAVMAALLFVAAPDHARASRSGHRCHTHRCFAHAAMLCKSHPACRARVASKRARRLARAQTSTGWAIPEYIVMCESRGQNLPPNSAGASGYYQIIYSTWHAYGGGAYADQAYLASKAGQDYVAGRIWHEAGASQWDCA